MTSDITGQTTGLRHARVVAERVRCQIAGTVSVATCRECVYLQRLEIDVPSSKPEWVICTPDDAGDEFEFAW